MDILAILLAVALGCVAFVTWSGSQLAAGCEITRRCWAAPLRDSGRSRGWRSLHRRAAGLVGRPPDASATVGGALLLGLTVLLVDAIVERSRARELRRTAAHPVVHLLNVAGSSELHAARENIEAVPFLGPPTTNGKAWTELPATENGLSSLELAAQKVATTVDQLRLDVLAGGADLFGVYEAALESAARAKRALNAVSEYRANVRPEDTAILRSGPPFGESEKRVEYVEWLWNEVGRAYNGLASSLQRLKATADTDLGPELDRVRGVVPGEGIRFRIRHSRTHS
jgi:hypothetical protein